MKTALSQHLNFNSLLIAAIGALAWYFWHDVSTKLDAVPTLVTNVAVISAKVDALEKNCVTEARISDLMARLNRRQAKE